MCTAVALQQPGQQGQQQSEGQEVQQEAQEDHSDHAGLGRRLLADGWVRSAAPTSSPAHDGGAPILPGPWGWGWRVCTAPLVTAARRLPYRGGN